MTPDEIRGHLASAWLMRDDRRRLERQLAAIERAPAAHPEARANCTPAPDPAPAAAVTAPQQPHAGAHYEHIAIEGEPAFVAATRAALDRLRPTPSWETARHLSTIRQTSDESAYAAGTVCCVGRDMWSDPVTYAGTIVHEATHVARGCQFSTEEERVAFTAEARALRQMGAPWSAVSAIQAQARSPTHHIDWARKWGWEVDEAGRPARYLANATLVRRRGPRPRRERRMSARPTWLRLLIG